MAAKKTTASEKLEGIDWSTDAGAGFEGVSQEDLGFPFLSIIQKGSPEVDEDHDRYIEGVKIGDVMLSSSKQVLGGKTTPVTVVPVGYKKAYVEWTPRESGGGYVGVHDRGILSQTSKNEKGHDFLANGNLIVTTAYIFANALDPAGDWIQVIISMTSTQLKKARQWLNIMTSHKADKGGKKFVLPMFSHKYSLGTVPESNEYGNWYGWKIEGGAMVSEQELALTCREQHKAIGEGAMSMLSAPSDTETDVPF